jgi:hypothetical protein
LATAGFARVAAKATGRPGYAPVDLLKLYVYGYLNRVRSRRRLEREANRNIFAPRALSASRRLETSLKRLKCATSGRSLTIDRVGTAFQREPYRSGRLDAPPFQPASARRNRMGKNTH